MPFPPDVQAAAAALRRALAGDRPRGSAVRAAVRALARTARSADVPAESLVAWLGSTLGPVLGTHHPGPVGDWLWDRIRAWAEADYVDGAMAAPASPVGDTETVPIGGGAAESPVEYQLDQRDVITHVNAAWRAFATENGAPALPSRVVGTSVWDHVGGDETRRLYRAVYPAVRRSARPVAVPFRCDAPHERRWMTLSVRPLGGGRLQVVSTRVRRAAQPPVPLLDPATRRGAGELLMCSLCKRVRVVDDSEGIAGQWGADGAWVDVAAVAPNPPDADIPRLVHDACPSCAADVRAILASA